MEKNETSSVNNPFLNIKKDDIVGSAEEQHGSDLELKNSQNTYTKTHKKNETNKKEKEKEKKRKYNKHKKNKTSDNENPTDTDSSESSESFRSISNDSYEQNKQKDRNSQPRKMQNVLMHSYSSSESDLEEIEKKKKKRNDTMKEIQKRDDQEKEEVGYVKSRIFANVSNEEEKLVFLPKKIREEKRKELEHQMKSKTINEKDEKNKRNEEYDYDRRIERNKDKNRKRKEMYNDKRKRDPNEDNKRKKESKEYNKTYENEQERKRGNDVESDKDINKDTKNDTYEKNKRTEKKKKEPIESLEEPKNTQIPKESELARLNMLNINKLETDHLKEREIEIIKQQYLGLNKRKKKIQKPSEKFRNIFNFEWDHSEDTSRNDNNPLYRNRLEPQLLFGRGYIAGIDVREQRKRNNFYDRLVQNRLNQNVNNISKQNGITNEFKYGSYNDNTTYEYQTKEEESEDSEEEEIEESEEEEYEVTAYVHPNESYETSVKEANAKLSKNKHGEILYKPQINHLVKEVQQKHWSLKTREEMNDRDWRIFREDNEIYIKGGIVPPPIRTWEESNLSSELLKAIKKAKYSKPTPIQMQAIPIALERRDLIGIAETGSGKTAAFVLPLLTYIKQLPPLTYETSQDGPYALIIAPSRELAIQIYEETNKFASYVSNIKSCVIVGGRKAQDQAFELRKGVEIVIGTPGRIQDCLEKCYTVLNQCYYVVLDEADRMMDMGFEEAVHFILDKTPSGNYLKNETEQEREGEYSKQEDHTTTEISSPQLQISALPTVRLTQMFSATMPPAVERLSRKYLRSPAFISIGDVGAGKRSIEQKLEFINEGKKKQKLQELLETYEPPIIVFVNQKKIADMIAKTINRMNFKAVALHGGKVQDLREQTLTAFKNAEYDILVATDVAGRGIDVHGVKLVINFDMPKDIETYTHRIGRTGRAGMKGLAISFVTEFDSHLFYDLKQFLLSSNNLVPLELANHPASKVKPGQILQTPKKNQVLYKN